MNKIINTGILSLCIALLGCKDERKSEQQSFKEKPVIEKEQKNPCTILENSFSEKLPIAKLQTNPKSKEKFINIPLFNWMLTEKLGITSKKIVDIICEKSVAYSVEAITPSSKNGNGIDTFTFSLKTKNGYAFPAVISKNRNGEVHFLIEDEQGMKKSYSISDVPNLIRKLTEITDSKTLLQQINKNGLGDLTADLAFKATLKCFKSKDGTATLLKEETVAGSFGIFDQDLDEYKQFILNFAATSKNNNFTNLNKNAIIKHMSSLGVGKPSIDGNYWTWKWNNSGYKYEVSYSGDYLSYIVRKDYK